MADELGQGFPRYYRRFDLDGCRVCDHRLRKGHAIQGLPLHTEALDRDTAEAIVRGLNDGTITPEEVLGTQP